MVLMKSSLSTDAGKNQENGYDKPAFSSAVADEPAKRANNFHSMQPADRQNGIKLYGYLEY